MAAITPKIKMTTTSSISEKPRLDGRVQTGLENLEVDIFKLLQLDSNHGQSLDTPACS